MLRELTHAEAFWSFQLGMSKICWVKSIIQKCIQQTSPLFLLKDTASPPCIFNLL